MEAAITIVVWVMTGAALVLGVLRREHRSRRFKADRVETVRRQIERGTLRRIQ